MDNTSFGPVIHWGNISRNKCLSEEFMEENKDKIDWNDISVFQTMSESFIEKHKDLVSWNGISRYQVLSEDFLIKHKDQVDWNIVCSSQILSREFMNNFIKKEIIPDTFSIEGLWSIISNNQPFVDVDNPLVDSRDLDENGLYKLYQVTKDQGWFIGYTWLSNTKKEIYFSETLSFMLRHVNKVKARIWWKDLIKLTVVRKFEKIREFKEFY